MRGKGRIRMADSSHYTYEDRISKLEEEIKELKKKKTFWERLKELVKP
jgi:hypothetical protein